MDSASSANTEPNHSMRNTLFAVFALSGFSGLIYESMWGNYLKLFLGHAAHAQTLVLAIFMGGMSLGAWISGTYSSRWRNLLRGYAVVEGIIGLFGLVFHGTFETVTYFAYTQIMPVIGSPLVAQGVKLLLSTLLILPQSILLGMTFPLMAAGVIRRFPQFPGHSLSFLYFSNSIGAAVGVLVSGFILITWIGLPGTILFAAVLNIFLALVIWFLASTPETPLLDTASSPSEPQPPAATVPSLWWLLLGVAMLTGFASFIYEIGWIRMLSLVLGSSTHAFEIMLSAFIGGLAFGGLWIKRRIDRVPNSVHYLGVVQIIMGLLALSTVVLYGQSFEIMQAAILTLAKTDTGYFVFNTMSHALALFIMFPAAFCAGMTLPLITYSLLHHGLGERSIGSVYAANTFGAILGVFFATHVGLPFLGLKGLIGFGASVDILLGLLLLWVVTQQRPHLIPILGGLCALAIVTVLFGIQLDTLKMASGVYRMGNLISPRVAKNIFHKDGKTATIDLVEYNSGIMSISTNGKPDASINLADERQPYVDEITMVMSAALPLAMYPDANTAAVIGMGSGLTSHVFLKSSTIRQVDTIEIEPAMVEGARRFGSRVENVFIDPRSRIFLDDAKTFFSTHNKHYDIIVSEPSNPWVSGVSSLFSDEFYQLITRHLAPKGLLAQWFQLYEIEPRLVASVLTALSKHFSNYVIYGTNDSDMLILASNDRSLQAHADIFEDPELAKELRRFHIYERNDLVIRKVGNRALLNPLFTSYGSPPNSDYFPFLDLNAQRSRYLQKDSMELINLVNAPIPVLEMLNGSNGTVMPTSLLKRPSADAGNSWFTKVDFIKQAEGIRDYYLKGKGSLSTLGMKVQLQKDVDLVKVRLLDCHEGSLSDVWIRSLFNVANAMNSFLTPEDIQQVWNKFERSRCLQSLSPQEQQWMVLLKAVGIRDSVTMAKQAEHLLKISPQRFADQKSYLLSVGMTGYLSQGKGEQSLTLWQTYGPGIIGNREPSLLLRLLASHSV